MTDAPQRIWVEPPYYTLHGEVPKVVWEAHWDELNAQAFDRVRVTGVEYIRADLAERQTQEAVAAERERCAKVAEQWLARDMHEAMTPGALEQNGIARQIAAAIREGGK